MPTNNYPWFYDDSEAAYPMGCKTTKLSNNFLPVVAGESSVRYQAQFFSFFWGGGHLSVIDRNSFANDLNQSFFNQGAVAF